MEAVKFRFRYWIYIGFDFLCDSVVKNFLQSPIFRPTAGAIILNSSINFANCSGNNDCAPSDQAFIGSLCTSISNASAPAATDARAIGGTLSLRPVPCEGSPVIGRWEAFGKMGMGEKTKG